MNKEIMENTNSTKKSLKGGNVVLSILTEEEMLKIYKSIDEMRSREIYVVLAVRNNMISYVVGVYENHLSEWIAKQEEEKRGGKIKCRIEKFILNDISDF